MTVAPVTGSPGKGGGKGGKGGGKGGKGKDKGSRGQSAPPGGRSPPQAPVAAVSANAPKDGPLSFKAYLGKYSPGKGCYTCYKAGRGHEHPHLACSHYRSWTKQAKAAQPSHKKTAALRAVKVQDNWMAGRPLDTGLEAIPYASPAPSAPKA